MLENIAYTKANLISIKNSLALSVKGFELLDKKRNVLILNLMSMIEKAKELQFEMKDKYADAYQALQLANISLGINNVQEIAYCIAEAEEFEVENSSVMGVPIPKIKYEVEPLMSGFSLYSSDASLDYATLQFYEVKKMLYELVEIEDSVYKLAFEIRRTQKRANALSNIQIPKYEELVKKITETLEEKEREEFFRLKKIKEKNQ